MVMMSYVQAAGWDHPPARADRRRFVGGPHGRTGQQDTVTANKDMSGENSNKVSFFVDNIVLLPVIRQTIMK